ASRAAASVLPSMPCGLAPAGLRPELVPSVEVVKVLPAVGNPAVLELEDDAVADIQVLAVPLRGAALDADHAALVISKQLLQIGLEGAPRLLPQLGEVGKHRVTALIVVSEAAPPRQVPRSALVEEFDERVHVARVERRVTAPHDRDVFIRSHHFPPARWSQSSRDTTTGPRTYYRPPHAA